MDYGHEPAVRGVREPRRLTGARDARAGAGSPTSWASTSSRSRTTPTTPSTSTPPPCSRPSPCAPARSGSRPTWPTCRSAHPSAWPSRSRPSTSSAGAAPSLGLGTGAFWDAIVAAGGERRTPGEAVDALVEAIRIIRGVWGQDPDQPGARSVTVPGEHYSVAGMHAGPFPVHRVEIWLGAYKPRMLRVTARLADGWLPSMGYADPEALAGMNAVIDEAADRAGRGPQAIRRMYNVFGSFGTGRGFLRGTADDWAEQAAGLALTEGMSTFVLGTDEPDVVRRYAAEVAPAVRDLVDAERASATPVHPAAAPVDGSPLTARATPDDGVRLSPALPWREDDRPVTAKAEHAAYSPAQQAVPQHLVDVHDHLRGELAHCATSSARCAVARCPPGRRARSSTRWRCARTTGRSGPTARRTAASSRGTTRSRTAASSSTCAAPSPTSARSSTGSRRSTTSSPTCSNRSTTPLSGSSGPRSTAGQARTRWTRSSAPSTCSPTRSCHTSPTRSASLLHPLARHGFG